MGDKAEFYRYFQQAAAEVREKIEGLKAPGLDATARDIAIAECLTGINDIAGEIGDQAHKATSHDQRTYNEVRCPHSLEILTDRWLIHPQTLKALKDQLHKVRSDIAPRRKFAFRPTAMPTSDASKTTRPQIGSTPVTEEILQQVAAGSPDSSSGGYEKAPTPYASLHNVLRTDRNLETADRGVSIANCSRSIVRYLTPSVALTITEAVAPLTGVGPEWWSLINDFNWLKGGQSPNWSILGPEDRSTAITWERVMEIGNDEEVDEVLPLFRVANA
ncbi:MAG: hypothetical protein Q9228_000903 [Teloschistes exilis]